MKKISVLFLIASAVALLGACTASTVIIDGRYTGTAEFNNGARADIDVYIKKQAVDNLLVLEYNDITVRKDGKDLGTIKSNVTTSWLQDTQDAIWSSFGFGTIDVSTNVPQGGSNSGTKSGYYGFSGTLEVKDNGMTFALINTDADEESDYSINYNLRALELKKE